MKPTHTFGLFFQDADPQKLRGSPIAHVYVKVSRQPCLCPGPSYHHAGLRHHGRNGYLHRQADCGPGESPD